MYITLYLLNLTDIYCLCSTLVLQRILHNVCFPALPWLSQIRTSWRPEPERGCPRAAAVVYPAPSAAATPAGIPAPSPPALPGTDVASAADKPPPHSVVPSRI